MAQAEWWLQEPLRMVQTVLREIDIEGYDVAKAMAYMEQLKANVLVVNAGGIMAFYPSKVSHHPRNPRMAPGQDLLREVVTACHARDIKVMCRVDFALGAPEVYEAEPGWFSVDAQGKPLMYNALYATCPNSPFRGDHAEEVIREILVDYQADGIWENAAAFSPRGVGPCYCEHCRRKFREEYGQELPTKEDWDDPAYRNFVRFRYDSATRHTKRYRDVIKRYGADKAYTAEFPGPCTPSWTRDGGLDIAAGGEYLDFTATECFDSLRGSLGSSLLPDPVWRSSEYAKYLSSAGGGKPTVVLFGQFMQAWRYSAVPNAEFRYWLAEALGNNGYFWNCTFVGAYPEQWWDKRNQDVLEDFYGILHDHGDLYHQSQRVADVAVVFSRRSQDRFTGTAGRHNIGDPFGDKYVTNFRGMEAALLEHHIPFDVIAERQLDAERLKKYHALVLPNGACLSDSEVAALREYVRGGGGLVATFETSRYDDKWDLRPNLALADVLGADVAGEELGPLPQSWLRLKAHNALTAGLEETELVASDGLYCNVKPHAGADVVCTLIPDIHPQPPEKGWTAKMDSDTPTMIANCFGAGRAVYFPGQIDRLNFIHGVPDYGLLLANAVRWAADGDLLVTDAPPGVEINVFAQPGRLLVHLVNGTSAPHRPITRLIPVGGFEVRVRSAGVKRARTAFGGRRLDVRQDGEYAVFTAPEVADYQVVVLEQ